MRTAIIFININLISGLSRIRVFFFSPRAATASGPVKARSTRAAEDLPGARIRLLHNNIIHTHTHTRIMQYINVCYAVI